MPELCVNGTYRSCLSSVRLYGYFKKRDGEFNLTEILWKNVHSLSLSHKHTSHNPVIRQLYNPQEAPYNFLAKKQKRVREFAPSRV